MTVMPKNIVSKDSVDALSDALEYTSVSNSGRFDQLAPTDLIAYLSESVGDAVGINFDSFLDVNVIDIEQRWDIELGLEGLKFDIVPLGTNRISYEVIRLAGDNEFAIEDDPAFEVTGQADDVTFGDIFDGAEDSDFVNDNDFLIVFDGVFNAQTAGAYVFDFNNEQNVEISFDGGEMSETIGAGSDGSVEFELEAGVHRIELKVYDRVEDRHNGAHKGNNLDVEVTAPGGNQEEQGLLEFVSVAPDNLYDVSVTALIEGIQDTFSFAVEDLADISGRVTAHYGQDMLNFGTYDGPVSLEELADAMGGASVEEFEAFLSEKAPVTLDEFAAMIGGLDKNLQAYDAVKAEYFSDRTLVETQTQLTWFEASSSLEKVIAVNDFAIGLGATLTDVVAVIRDTWTVKSETAVADVFADFAKLTEEEFLASQSAELFAALSNITAVLSDNNSTPDSFVENLNGILENAVDILTLEANFGAQILALPNFSDFFGSIQAFATYESELGLSKEAIVEFIGGEPSDMMATIEKSVLPLDELPEEASRSFNIQATTGAALGIEEGGIYTFSAGGEGVSVELLLGEGDDAEALISIDDEGSKKIGLAETEAAAVTVNYTFADAAAMIENGTAFTMQGPDTGQRDLALFDKPEALLNNDTFKDTLESIVDTFAGYAKDLGLLPMDLGFLEVAHTLDASIGMDIDFNWDIDLPSLGKTLTNQPIEYTISYPDAIMEGADFSVFVDELSFMLPTTASSFVELGKIDIETGMTMPETQFGGIGVGVKSSSLLGGGAFATIGNLIAPGAVDLIKNSPIGELDSAFDGLFELNIQMDKTIDLGEILAAGESLAESLGVEVDLSKGIDISAFIMGLFSGDEAVIEGLKEMKAAVESSNYVGAFNAFLKLVGLAPEGEEEPEEEEAPEEEAEGEEADADAAEGSEEDDAEAKDDENDDDEESADETEDDVIEAPKDSLDEENIDIKTTDGEDIKVSPRELMRMAVEASLKKAADDADISGVETTENGHVVKTIETADGETVEVKIDNDVVEEKLESKGITDAFAVLKTMFTEGIEVVAGLEISGELPLDKTSTQVGFTADDAEAIDSVADITDLYQEMPTQIISTIETKLIDVQMDFNKFSEEALKEAVDAALQSPTLDPATKGVLVAVRSAIAMQPLLIDTFEEGASGTLKVNPAAFLQALTNIFLETFDAIGGTINTVAKTIGVNVDIKDDFADDAFLKNLFVDPDNLEHAVGQLTDPLADLFGALPAAMGDAVKVAQTALTTVTNAIDYPISVVDNSVDALVKSIADAVDSVVSSASAFNVPKIKAPEVDVGLKTVGGYTLFAGLKVDDKVAGLFENMGFTFDSSNKVIVDDSSILNAISSFDQITGAVTKIKNEISSVFSNLLNMGANFAKDAAQSISDAFAEMPAIAAKLVQGIEAGVDLDLRMDSVSAGISVDLQQTTVFNPDELMVEYTYMGEKTVAKYGEAVVFTAPEYMDADDENLRSVDVKLLYEGAYDYVYSIIPDFNFDMEQYGFSIANYLELGGTEIYDFKFDYAFMKTVGADDWDPDKPLTWFDDALIEIPTEQIKTLVNEQLIDTVRDFALDSFGLDVSGLDIDSGEIPFFFIEDVPSLIKDDGEIGFTSIEDSVLLEMANLRPRVEEIEDQVSTEGSVSTEVGSYFSDPEGDALVFTASGLPKGTSLQTLESGETVIAGTAAAGEYTVTVYADDQNGGVTAAEFSWTVNALDAMYAKSEAKTLEDGTIVDFDGDSAVFGTSGSDAIVKLDGHGHLDGGAGHDKIVGGFLGDVLIGGEGNDMLIGDVSTYLSGSDTLNGGLGDDLMSGGGMADTFVFAKGDGSDVIAGFDRNVDNTGTVDYSALELNRDFVVGQDTVKLLGFEGLDASNIMDHVSQGENGAIFNAQGTEILFWGVDVIEFNNAVFEYL